MAGTKLVELLQDEFKDDSRISFVPFDVSDVEVEERVRLKCMVPPCPFYGRRKFCPPNLPDLDFIRKAIAQYQGGAMVILAVPANEENMAEIKQWKPQNELMEIVGRCEKIAFEKLSHLAFALTIGGCHLCEECTPNDEPCKYPLKVRPGADGYGIDVTTLARKLGVQVEWPVQNEFKFLGMVFV